MLIATMLLTLAHAEEVTPTVGMTASAAAFSTATTSDGLADDDTDIGVDSPESSTKSEKSDLKKASATDAAADSGKQKKRVIKTIQKKNFVKVGRSEAGAFVGFVANDPFLNRYIVNGVFDYHLTEIFSLEAQLGYSPILGGGGESDPDWKPLSKQLLLENSVSPDISKLTAHGSVGLMYSPIYGKAAVGHKIIVFDIYGGFGLGATQTTDDLVALQAENEPDAIATQNQWHPTTVINVGARVAFNPTVAARIEGKSMSYIETVSSTTLEMKNNFILQGGVTFFFPGMK